MLLEHPVTGPVPARTSASGPRVKAPLRLLVVDGHTVVRDGLVSMLVGQPGFLVVGQAGTVVEAVALARLLEPDLVLMEARLPDGSGADACRAIRLKRPATHVVLLTAEPARDSICASIRGGASAYVLKQVRSREILAALEAAGRGETLLDPPAARRLLRLARHIGAWVPANTRDPIPRRTSDG